VTVLSELITEQLGELAPFAIYSQAGGTEDGSTLRISADFGETLLEILSITQGTLDVFLVEFVVGYLV
jgi:hypothetical protein